MDPFQTEWHVREEHARKTNVKRTNSRPVKFSCHAPKAKAVFVAGTFNGWKPDAAALRPHPPNGTWIVTLPLPPGRHECKFVVDGRITTCSSITRSAF